MADPTDDFVIEHPVSIRHKVYDYLKNEILFKARGCWRCVKCSDTIYCGTGSKACMPLRQV